MLPLVESIVVLNEGRIVDVGTYEEVATRSETLTGLLKAHSEDTSKVHGGIE